MPKRKGKALFVPRVRGQISLGAAAENVVVSADLADTLDEEAFLISEKSTWALSGNTPGEGPIDVGVAHSDYSDAEIEEWLENQGSWDRGDMIAREVNRRKIRLVGTFAADEDEEVLNDGKPIKTTCKWGLVTGQTLKLWAYNRHGTRTTGAVVKVEGEAYFRPK